MAHTAVLPGIRVKSGSRLKSIVKRALDRVSVPSSVRNLANMPLTVLGIGSTVAGIALICLPAALIVLGPVLVGLEYLIADGV